MEPEIDEIYNELEAARIELEALRTTNAHALDTPKKKFDWDVAYAKAMARLDAAEVRRMALVERAVRPPSRVAARRTGSWRINWLE
jgi:hypothetical protein